MTRLLERLALWAGRHARLVFAGAGILALVSLGLALRLRFETDVLNLLPHDDPVVDDFRKLVDRFGSLDMFLVGIQIPEGADLEPYQGLADRIADALDGLDEIEYVDYRLGSPEEMAENLLPNALLFLDEGERRQLAARLQPEGLRQRASELRQLLTTPQAMAVKPLIRLDPLGLSDFFLERIQGTGGALRVDLSSGYYLSGDHQLLLVLAKPRRPAQDIDFSRELVGAVEKGIDGVKRQWAKDRGRPVAEAPETFLGGGHLTALDDASLIRADIIWNAVTSLGIVLLLFLWAFHRLGPVLFAAVPLIVGVILTFGFTALSLGRMSSVTGGVGALLIGLAIDFVIVSYGRYVEERRQGASVGRAVRRMSGSSGRAVTVGAVTSAATFYAFLVTDFTGLRHMGLIAGTGILICMVTVLVLLPAMLVWNEEHHRRRDRIPKMFLHAFGTARLIRWSLSFPRTTLAIGGVITLVLGASAFRLEFHHNLREMRAPQNRGVQALDEVNEHFGASFEFMSLMISSPDLEEVLSLADEASRRAAGLVGTGSLDGYESISTLIPPPARQRAALAWLKQGGPSLDPGPVRASLERALREEGLNPAGFARGLDLLEEAFAVDGTLSPETLALSEENQRLLERYLRREDGEWQTVVRLYPPPVIWKSEPPPDVVELAAELGPRVTLTGINVVSAHLRSKSKHQAVTAAVLGFILVALILWWDFGRLRDAAISLAPLCVGVVWMLGLMAVLGIQVNLLNIFVTTMIIGIGVDYGIHALHRYREAAEGDPAALGPGLLETGKAIALAAMSTVVGFGSGALSRYPGLRSVGYVAILGAVATAFVSITLLPAFFRLRMDAREARRARDDASA